MRTKGVALAGSCLASAALLDLVRLALSVLGLRKLRRDNPAMFDGSIAAQTVKDLVSEYAQEIGLTD